MTVAAIGLCVVLGLLVIVVVLRALGIGLKLHVRRVPKDESPRPHVEVHLGEDAEREAARRGIEPRDEDS